jgi:hypothetical protein
MAEKPLFKNAIVICPGVRTRTPPGYYDIAKDDNLVVRKLPSLSGHTKPPVSQPVANCLSAPPFRELLDQLHEFGRLISGQHPARIRAATEEIEFYSHSPYLHFEHSHCRDALAHPPRAAAQTTRMIEGA